LPLKRRRKSRRRTRTRRRTRKGKAYHRLAAHNGPPVFFLGSAQTPQTELERHLPPGEPLPSFVRIPTSPSRTRGPRRAGSFWLPRLPDSDDRIAAAAISSITAFCLFSRLVAAQGSLGGDVRPLFIEWFAMPLSPERRRDRWQPKSIFLVSLWRPEWGRSSCLG
jgi:hypothetical protein